MFGNKQEQIDQIRDALRDLEVKVSKLEFNIVKLGFYQSSYEKQEAVLKALLDRLGLDWEYQPEKIVLKKKGK